jgi:hypothetical protein
MLVNARLLTPDDRLEAFLRSASGLPGADPDSVHEEPEPPPVPDPAPAVPEPANSIRVRAHTRRKNNDPPDGETLW